MHNKTKEMMKKLKNILLEEDYSPADHLAKKCHMSVATVYRMIRLMREEGIGVHPAKKGYVLSEFAGKVDDVLYLRKLLGRRASDFVAMQAAKPHIEKRWNSVEDRRNLALIVSPLSSDPKRISSGTKILSIKAEKLGI